MTRIIKAARQHAEGYMRRTIVETVFTWKLKDFPLNDAALRLPRNTVVSVDSITYTDTDGNTQTFTDYLLKKGDSESIIVPAYNKSWPETRGYLDDVTIEFTAGYVAETSPTDYRANIPESIKQAILLLVGHMYENRESVTTDAAPERLPMGYEYLLWPHRVLEV